MPRPTTPTLAPYTSQLPDVNNPATWAERTPLFWNWVTGPGYTNLDDLLTYSESAIGYVDAALAGSESLVDAVAAIPIIGIPFPVWDHITGCPVPSNAGAAKFIKLTAGLTGAGQYNEGLLTSESVSGSAPAITATAVIVGGPMDGQTVPLINTAQAFIRPRTTSGVLQADEIRSHTHSYVSNINGSYNGANGDLQNGVAGTNTSRDTGSTGGDETRPRNISATFYMRTV